MTREVEERIKITQVQSKHSRSLASRRYLYPSRYEKCSTFAPALTDFVLTAELPCV